MSVEPLKRTVGRSTCPNKSKFANQLLRAAHAWGRIKTRAWRLAGSGLIAIACVSSRPPSDASNLPQYSAEDAALLDDGFSGHLFETAFVSGVAGDDPRFDDRVRAAENIWVVKVATVSRAGSTGNNRRYEVTLRPLAGLAGPPPPAEVSLTISGKDPSFHWLDRVGGAWVGRELLLLSRDYRAANPERRALHFHGEPNTPELQARIAEVRAELARERAAQQVKK